MHANQLLALLNLLACVCGVLCMFVQHAGDMRQAAMYMDEARQMDTADRYINCKAAKYMLRVNEVEKAEELCALFTRVSLAI